MRSRHRHGRRLGHGLEFTDQIISAGTTISGSVTNGQTGEVIYLDANNNAVLDDTELSTTPTLVGTCSFTNVPAGIYLIHQVLPGRVSQVTPAVNYGLHITATSGQPLVNENFTDSSGAADRHRHRHRRVLPQRMQQNSHCVRRQSRHVL